jgi:hypothetical protein
MDRITFATSSGVTWLILAFHFGVGLIAIVGGTIALSVNKGGQLHKQSGMAFTYAMIALGLTASVISAIGGKSVIGGLFVVYLIFTAVTTVKPVPGAGRRIDVGLMVFAFVLAALMYYGGVLTVIRPGYNMNGAPAGMTFFLATIALLAAVGDLRMIREGPPRGSRRIARHLWRMCFGLFIATGSFFLGQMRFIPQPVRILPLMFVLALAPLVILLYWMWRVRLRGKLSGMTITRESQPVA